MKYWLFGAGNTDFEPLMLYGVPEVDYQNKKVTFKTSDKDDISDGKVDDYLVAGGEEKVVSVRVAEVIEHLDLEGVEVWEYSAELPGRTYEDTWKYIVVANHVDCIDFQRSDMKIREDGSIRRIRELVIDERKADLAGYHMFRLHEEFPRVVVSDIVKQSIESLNPVGIKFKPTDGS